MAETLFPYQLEGAKWLTTQSFCLLADEMGLGKSAQSIHAADLINAKSILILCPSTARINWTREFQKFSHIDREFYVIETRLPDLDTHVNLVCSYSLVEAIPVNLTFDLLILDESHYLKSHTASRTQMVFGSKGLVHRAKKVWALSGTPCPNNASELWVLLYTFGKTPLKYNQFVEKYCTFYDYYNPRGPVRRNITGTNEAAIPELKKILEPIMLRRKKDEVLKDLPPIYYSDFVVEAGKVDIDQDKAFFDYLFPRTRLPQLYEKIKADEARVEAAFKTIGIPLISKNQQALFHEMEGNPGLTNLEIQTMCLITALAPSLATLRRYTGLQKVEALANKIEEEMTLGYYDKCVIFAIHQSVIEALRQKLKRWHPVTLYGGTPPEKRVQNIDKFQNTNKHKIFIGQIQAAGTAITLTRANFVFILEPSWVPAENQQAVARCHRISATKPVYVQFCLLANSIDEKIGRVLRHKTNQIDKLLNEDQINFKKLNPAAAPNPIRLRNQ